MYEYRCKVEQVIDGNTILADIDLGFNLSIKQKVRLYGVASPSIQSTSEDERKAATESYRRLVALLPKECVIKTVLNKRGKFGRILGYLYVIDKDGNTLCVNDILIKEGLATPHESQNK